MKRWGWLSLAMALFAAAIAFTQRSSGAIDLGQFKALTAHPVLAALFQTSPAPAPSSQPPKFDSCTCAVSLRL